MLDVDASGFGFLWSFNTEKAARDCLALLVAGDNLREGRDEGRARIAYNDDGWELSIRVGNSEDLAWYRGFACGFVRMTPGERESELGSSLSQCRGDSPIALPSIDAILAANEGKGQS
jgi:hypothetical protein